MPKKASITELGGTGTYIVNGYITNHDYNAQLTGWSRIDHYDKMRKGDATVRASLLAVFLPILSTEWYIEPASDNAKDVEIAEHVKKELFERNISWATKLREILLYLAYGSYVFEKIWTRREDGFIGIEKIAPRLPKTILKWETDDNQPGITQTLPTGTTANIPAWKLLTFINEQEGDNYEGTSLLRTSYKHWYYKERYYKIDAMAQERQGLGLPYFKKPSGANVEDVQKMRELMRNLRANEEAYLEIISGWEAGILEMKAGSTKDAKPMIDHHDRQISKNVLAQFLELGADGGSGSRALSEDHSDLFLLAENAVAQYIKEVVQKDLIKELVDYNYTVEQYPQLKYGSIGMVDYEKLSGALQSLSAAKLITTTYKTEQYLRKTMKLPEITEEEYTKIREQIRSDALLTKTKQLESDTEEGDKSKDGQNDTELEDDQENENNSQKQKKVKAADSVVEDVIKFSEAIKHAIITKESQITGS